MFKLQCDKNFKNILKKFFDQAKIPSNVTEFNDTCSDLCILRNSDELTPGFLPTSRYIILNSDDRELIKQISGVKSKIITCGMSTRSSITFSSISERNFVMCFQRSVTDLLDKKIPPFEMPFELCGILFDETSVLMLLTAALLCGADISLLNKIYL